MAAKAQMISHGGAGCLRVLAEWEDAGQVVEGPEQGFLTSQGRYVDRHEAAGLMAEVGWVSRLSGYRIVATQTLLSEDLY
jgi:hypothetical protein